MRRRASELLSAWRSHPARKPLVLRGARQVGKTWLLREFGRTAYQNVAYVNCQRDQSVREIFAGDLDPARVIQALQIAANSRIDPATTLVIIDEIQDAPRAITSLKYFQEERPDIHVAAAGSLLGIATREPGVSFPVGKVDYVDLHPLDFDEFLRGTGEDQLAELLDGQDWTVIRPFRARLTEALRRYMFVGGMPEVVAAVAAGDTLEAARAIQEAILHGYEGDFAKHPGINVDGSRISEVWRSLPTQLARENRRFIFGHVREGGRGRMYADAIEWLSLAGLVHKVCRYTKPGAPLRSYEDPSIFKLFLLDVGLLGALARLDARVLLNGLAIFQEFKGTLTEQFVLQQLVAAQNREPAYWTPGNAEAEVDFAIEVGPHIIPIEVKAEENLRSKSLRAYIGRFKPDLALRFSLSNYREQHDMTNVPLYGALAFVRRLRL